MGTDAAGLCVFERSLNCIERTQTTTVLSGSPDDALPLTVAYIDVPLVSNDGSQ